jgi:hypothetical protein
MPQYSGQTTIPPFPETFMIQVFRPNLRNDFSPWLRLSRFAAPAAACRCRLLDHSAQRRLLARRSSDGIAQAERGDQCSLHNFQPTAFPPPGSAKLDDALHAERVDRLLREPGQVEGRGRARRRRTALGRWVGAWALCPAAGPEGRARFICAWSQRPVEQAYPSYRSNWAAKHSSPSSART